MTKKRQGPKQGVPFSESKKMTEEQQRPTLAVCFKDVFTL